MKRKTVYWLFQCINCFHDIYTVYIIPWYIYSRDEKFRITPHNADLNNISYLLNNIYLLTLYICEYYK